MVCSGVILVNETDCICKSEIETLLYNMCTSSGNERFPGDFSNPQFEKGIVYHY